MTEQTPPTDCIAGGVSLVRFLEDFLLLPPSESRAQLAIMTDPFRATLPYLSGAIYAQKREVYGWSEQ
jgi:hypothetical protein